MRKLFLLFSLLLLLQIGSSADDDPINIVYSNSSTTIKKGNPEDVKSGPKGAARLLQFQPVNVFGPKKFPPPPPPPPPKGEVKAVEVSFQSIQKRDSRVRPIGNPNAKWIWPGWDFWPEVTYITPCFHNPCPNNSFTMSISTYCLYYVRVYNTQTGAVVYSWWGSWYSSHNFKLPCGNFYITITTYGCFYWPYLQYSLQQDQTGCFNCPDNIRQTYNPRTCNCQCIVQCPCNNKLQRWSNDYCTCICSQSLYCPPGYVFNKKRCACEWTLWC